MQLLKKLKIEVAIIALNIIFIVILLFLGCNNRSGFLLDQYRGRNVVKNSEGDQYKVMYESKFSQGYGCFISVYKSSDGQNWNKIGAIPSYGYETYEVWGYSLTYKEGALYFVYIGTGKGKKAVYFTKSLDEGKTWAEPVIVNDDIWAQRYYPKLAIKGKDIFVIWLEESERSPLGEGRASGIYFSSSYDGGESWTEDVWIRQGEEHQIEIGTDGTVYIIYVSGKRRNIIYLSYSKDKGINWYTETTGELPMMVKEPYIVFAGRSIYLIFQGARPNVSHLIPGSKLDYQLYYLKSGDAGKSWSRITELK